MKQTIKEYVAWMALALYTGACVCGAVMGITGTVEIVKSQFDL